MTRPLPTTKGTTCGSSTSLRRLTGLAIVSLRGDRPGGGVGPRRRRSLQRVERRAPTPCRSSQQAPDGTLTPGASYLTGGAGSGAAGLGSQGALAARARLAARRQRRLERRLGVPRARRSPRARQPRALRRHDAQQRHAPRRHRLRAQQRRQRQHQRLQAQPPRPGAADRRDAAAVERDRRRRAGLVHAARRPARRLREGRQHDRDLSRSTAGAAPEPVPPTPRPGAAPFGFAFGKRDSLQRDRGGRQRAHAPTSSIRSRRSRRRC